MAEKISIPMLPPLAELHRIVAKVNSLMALCDALESQLKARAGVQRRLAGAMVKQVAG
jgi:type I restriction enzyme S subunit